MMIRVYENSSTSWPYSLAQLREDEPSRSFSINPSDQELAHYGVFRVEPQPQPEHDPTEQRVEETHPCEVSGQWRQSWVVVSLTEAEREAYYRATHPPRWLEFGAAAMAMPQINAMLASVLTTAPSLAMTLPVGLSKAADGDSRVFLTAWNAARSAGLVSTELALALQQLATSHDLPAEFSTALGDQPWQWPAEPQRGDEWIAPDGSRWRWDQPRNTRGQYVSDDPSTEPVESAPRWLEVNP